MTHPPITTGEVAAALRDGWVPTPTASGKQAGNPLHVCLAEVMGGLTRIREDGRNAHQGYSYASVEAMLEAIRGPLAAAGVTIVQAHHSILSDQESPTKNAGSMREVCVLFDFILTHAPSGYREVWQFAGVGSDTSDKWYSKASTSAEKFFVRRLFLMTTGDEDPDGGGEERAAKPHASSTSARAQAPSGSWVPSDAQKRLVFGKGKAAGIEPEDLRRLLWFAGGWTDSDQIDDRGKFDRLLEVIDGIGGDPDLQAEVAAHLASNPYPTA